MTPVAVRLRAAARRVRDVGTGDRTRAVEGGTYGRAVVLIVQDPVQFFLDSASPDVPRSRRGHQIE